MSILKKIKSDVKKSGQSKSKFIYFREGQKTRVRFLQDVEDGLEVEFFDSFEQGINVPNQELFGRDNSRYEEDETLRRRSQYIWSVWDYDAKEVKLFMSPVNNYTAVPALIAMYENYGTLLDRDYVITVTGRMQNKSFSVVPMDKVKFRNNKAKPFSKQAVLKMLDKAWPSDVESDLEKHDDVTDLPSDSSEAYEDMSVMELYKLCVEREIEVPKRKSSTFYINQLAEWDKAQDDWGSDEEDEDWDDVIEAEVDEWEELENSEDTEDDEDEWED